MTQCFARATQENIHWRNSQMQIGMAQCLDQCLQCIRIGMRGIGQPMPNTLIRLLNVIMRQEIDNRLQMLVRSGHP